MSQYVLEAKDCLPFEVKGGKPIQYTIDMAMRQFCDYWHRADGYSDGDDYLARMHTALAFDDSANPTTQWWAGRYIGMARLRVHVNAAIHHVNINIRPRFGENFLLVILEDLYNIKVGEHDAKDTQSSEWFSSLLYLLQKRIWVEKCSKANRYGLPRTNVKCEHQGATLRGALDVNRTIIPWLIHKEVCSNTYEKTIDEHICKIVYEAHRILSRSIISQESKKKKSTNTSVGFGFSMPSTVQDTINALNTQFKGTRFDLNENDYQRIRYKSIYQSWKPLVDFSWSIIRGRRLGYTTSDNQTECVFVDMAEIWESFLRKKLGEGLADEGWRVWPVEECRHTIYEKTFYKRDIIPDIILQKGDRYIVFDAKYKRMQGKKQYVKDSDVDRADLFQIHTYIQYVQHHIGKVVLGGLLYPLEVDIDGNDASVLNTFHSKQLFGCDAKVDNNEPIPFIIDGIYCNEKEMNNRKPKEIADEMEKRVKGMINRIKKYIN
jgi:5-methylcytosine-specific restriction endonuclease McrBC regulatory subunit McrC